MNFTIESCDFTADGLKVDMEKTENSFLIDAWLSNAISLLLYICFTQTHQEYFEKLHDKLPLWNRNARDQRQKSIEKQMEKQKQRKTQLNGSDEFYKRILLWGNLCESLLEATGYSNNSPTPKRRSVQFQ